MEVIETLIEDNTCKIVFDSNEESLLYLIKAYLEKLDSIDLVGIVKDHHLVDKTEFFVKVVKGDPLKIVKSALADIKKDLESKKL